MPLGVPGELYIGGAGLALGYHRRPELTSERFVPNPFTPGTRLYKTGDSVRRLADGNIEFLGRLDHQVKIRGFRIELGEIEATLRQFPGVRDAIVIAEGDTEKRLTAWLLVDEKVTPMVPELRAFLKQHLPPYMIPAAFVCLNQFPLTPNGKVNRKALPRPGTASVQTSCVEPKSELERLLFEVWQSVLGHRSFGVQDDFFEVGGHSLLTVKLMAQIEKAIGKRLPVQLLFRAATIEKLAEALGENAPSTPGSCLVTIQPNGSRPPIFWPHTLGGGAGGGLFTYRKLAALLGPDQPSYGFVAPALPFTTLESMAAHYIEEMQRVQPQGPYYLGGYCFAGVVAFEMARQLQELGRPVELLTLIDSAPPDPAGDCTRLSLKLLLHVLRTLPLWAGDFISRDFDEIRATLRWKAAIWNKRLRKNFFKTASDEIPRAVQDLEELVNMANYPPEYRHFARIHWNALMNYSPRPFAGRALLLKSEDRYLFRLDGVERWKKLILGGLEVKKIHGRHQTLLEDPSVHILASRLSEHLQHLHRG